MIEDPILKRKRKPSKAMKNIEEEKIFECS